MPTLDQARDHILRQYGDDIGTRREELITPALVLDIDAAQRNIDRLAGELRQMGAAGIRPHYKAHKSPDLAWRQLPRRRAQRLGSWSRSTPGWTGAAPTPRNRPWPWRGR